MNPSLWFFSPRTRIYGVEVEVGGAIGGPRGRGRAQGGRRAPTLMDRVWAPWCWFFRQYFLLILKSCSVDFQVIPRTFISAQKQHQGSLLKTASIRVSFIQIMQIRVQNKSNSIRKSRYDGDVSTPASVNFCLSSSNSVDKLKMKKENFYELFCSCLRK